jgi:hypothetical protein
MDYKKELKEVIEKLVEVVRKHEADIMVFKEYLSIVINDRKKNENYNFSYGKKRKAPKHFKISTPDFVKIEDLRTGKTFVMEQDDYFKMLATQKYEQDMKELS